MGIAKTLVGLCYCSISCCTANLSKIFLQCWPSTNGGNTWVDHVIRKGRAFHYLRATIPVHELGLRSGRDARAHLRNSTELHDSNWNRRGSDSKRLKRGEQYHGRILVMTPRSISTEFRSRFSSGYCPCQKTKNRCGSLPHHCWTFSSWQTTTSWADEREMLSET